MTVQEKSHTWVYVAIVVVIVALMAAGVARYRTEQDSTEAHAKAKELIAKLGAAGFKSPDEQAIVDRFGADGGVAAQNPGSALLQAQFAMRLGNAGPASRSVIIDKDLLRAEAIILEVYAPQKLAEYQAFLDGLRFGETQ